MHLVCHQVIHLKMHIKKMILFYLIFSKENEILVLNNKSQFQWKKTINCSSIDKIIITTLQSSHNNKIIMGILDGIENKILLLDSQGSSIDDVKRHGEKDLQITNYEIQFQ